MTSTNSTLVAQLQLNELPASLPNDKKDFIASLFKCSRLVLQTKCRRNSLIPTKIIRSRGNGQKNIKKESRSSTSGNFLGSSLPEPLFSTFCCFPGWSSSPASRKCPKIMSINFITRASMTRRKRKKRLIDTSR